MALGQDEVVIQQVGFAGIQQALAVEVPLDIDGTALQQTGAEVAIDGRGGR